MLCGTPESGAGFTRGLASDATLHGWAALVIDGGYVYL